MKRYLAIPALLLSACATEPTDDAALSATDDALIVEMNASAELVVTDNDQGIDQARVVELVEGPTHGEATLPDDTGALFYTAEAGYLGEDSVRYRITNPDGSTAEATVAIDVRCATCAIGTPIRLAWDPNAPSDMVLGYRVYLGPTEDPISMVMVDEVTVDAPGFDPAMPGAEYDAWGDFHLRLGDYACFRLTAYNAAGESGFSNAACKLVDGTSMRFGL